MLSLQVKIDNNTADEITLKNLKNIYVTFLNELEQELDGLNNLKENMPLDIDEEIFETVQMCKSLETILSYFGETKKSTTSILKQTSRGANCSIYD